MLSRIHRLASNADISKVQKSGRWVKGRVLGLKFQKNSSRVSRFAFVVSNKVSKKAVERNAIRRKMRETVRTTLQRIKPGYDVVLVAFIGAAKQKGSQITDDTQTLLKKAKLYIQD